LKVAPLPEHFNPDVHCLRCGAFNIPDNLVCGNCGANLPLVFGADGKPRILMDDVVRYSTMAGKPHGGGFLSDPATRGENVRWVLRFLVILGAIVFAIWVLSRR
jgi:hypothetical protein